MFTIVECSEVQVCVALHIVSKPPREDVQKLPRVWSHSNLCPEVYHTAGLSTRHVKDLGQCMHHND